MYGRHQNALRRMTSLLKGSGFSKGEAGALLSNDAFVILKGEFSDLALCWLGMPGTHAGREAAWLRLTLR